MDDELEVQEEVVLEHLPEAVLQDIICIAGWLVEYGRNQGMTLRAWLLCALHCSSIILFTFILIIFLNSRFHTERIYIVLVFKLEFPTVKNTP